MEEVWKPMIGHEKYSVSNFGRIMNNETMRIYEGKPGSHGYTRVCLSENGKRFIKFCHREVAKSFIPRIHGKDFVNHKDGNRQNSRVDNLEWCTLQENAIHAVRELGFDPARHNRRSVLCVENGIVYKSCSDAAKSVNGFNSGVVRCCKGGRKHYKGFTWRYL